MWYVAAEHEGNSENDVTARPWESTGPHEETRFVFFGIKITSVKIKSSELAETFYKNLFSLMIASKPDQIRKALLKT